MSLAPRILRGKPRVTLLVPTFFAHDAVANDVFGMYQALRANEYDVRIMAENVHPDRAPFTQVVNKESDADWNSPDDILIYHHAIDWRLGEKILARTKGRIIIKHHNVTPPRFYAGYVPHYLFSCTLGMEATRRLARLPNALFCGDSGFNVQDFIKEGVPEDRCHVLPPMHGIEDLAAERLDMQTFGAYYDRRPNILFVGGLRPNKGHFKALDVFSEYLALSGRGARLFLVGNYDPELARYVEDLKQYAKYLEVTDDVVFASSVNPSQLRTYYTIASAFLCVSEHEGFCVPLVEAMFFRVPIVAWAMTAVGETCRGAALLHEEFDAEAMAKSLDDCIENPALARSLASQGRERYDARYRPAVLESGLLDLIGKVHSA